MTYRYRHLKGQPIDQNIGMAHFHNACDKSLHEAGILMFIGAKPEFVDIATQARSATTAYKQAAYASATCLIVQIQRIMLIQKTPLTQLQAHRFAA